MSIDEIIEFIGALDGVVILSPGPGDGTPEISWGDSFFYYSPDGTVPAATQPFATIVTKDYPDDENSDLNRPGAFRVNVAAGREAFRTSTGHEPGEPGEETNDPSQADTLTAHPVYGSLGWLAVVNPGPRTEGPMRDLLTAAHQLARSRFERREQARPD